MMGKFGIWGFLVLVVLFAATSAWAKKARHATVLPSRVKTIHLEPTGGAVHVTVSAVHANAPSAKAPNTGARWFSPELVALERDYPDSRYFLQSKVQYAHSSAPIPASYDCDADAQEQQLRQAEQHALEACEADGATQCRIAKSLIRRNGVLRCQDFPQGRCPAGGHYRGCRAEALAIGEKSALAAGL